MVINCKKMDLFTQKFDLFNFRIAKTVLANRRMNSDWFVGWEFAKHLLKIFPDSIDIKDEAALAAYYSKNYIKSAEIINEILDSHPNRILLTRVMENKRFCVPHLLNKALEDEDEGYESNENHESHVNNESHENNENNENHETSLNNLKNSPFIFVCSGSSVKTVKNFLKYCTDVHLFSHFYYLYDNENEKKNIKPTFPKYFEFVQFNKSILNSLGNKCTAYIFNMVGNWVFFDRRNYVTIMRDILDSAGHGTSYGQVLINQNYSQFNSKKITDWNYEGYEKYTTLSRRYYETVNDIDLISPSLLNREVLYEYDFKKNYRNNHQTALMDGIHTIPR